MREKEERPSVKKKRKIVYIDLEDHQDQRDDNSNDETISQKIIQKGHHNDDDGEDDSQYANRKKKAKNTLNGDDDGDYEDNHQDRDVVIYMDENNRLTDNAMDRFAMSALAGNMNLRRKKLFNIGYKPEVFHMVSRPLGWVRSHSVCKIVSEVERFAGSSDPERVINSKWKMSKETKERLIRSMGLGNIETKRMYKLSQYDTVFFSLYDEDHWSVLVCYAQNQGLKYLYHYDSLSRYHVEYAKRVKNALIACGVLPSSAHIYSHKDYPQQNSFYECGYSVLTLVCRIGTKYVQKDNMRDISEGVEPLSSEEFPRSNSQKIKTISECIFRGLGNTNIAAYPDENAMLRQHKSSASSVDDRTNSFYSPLSRNNSNNNNNTNDKAGLYMCSKYHCMRQTMLPK